MKDPHTNEFIGSIGYRNQIRSHVIWPYRAKSVLYVLIPTWNLHFRTKFCKQRIERIKYTLKCGIKGNLIY